MTTLPGLEPELELARLEPVMIEHTLDHKFVDGSKKGCNLILADGTRCGAAKTAVLHHPYPPSFNDLGSGDRWGYQAQKQKWTEFFEEALNASGLPRGLARVAVEGEWTFPRKPGKGGKRGPDQDNYRFPVSKALGDALENGGWLEGDYWLAYQFDGGSYRYEKGVEMLRLTIFPFPHQSGM